MSQVTKPNSSQENPPLTFGFLTYLSRSGSTFLSNKLNEYQDICVTVEAHLPPELFGIHYRQPEFKSKNEIYSYLKEVLTVSKLQTWPINIEEICDSISFKNGEVITGNDLLRVMLRIYRDVVKPNAKVVIYKGNPIMPWLVSEMTKHLKDWKIIHLIRDPRAVYASQKRNILPYSNKKFASSPIEVAYDWRRGIKGVENNHINESINIKYEDLIVDFDSSLNDIQQFLGVTAINSDENSFKKLIPEEEQSIHTKVGKKADKSRIDSWKEELKQREIALIDAYLHSVLKKYNYKQLPVNNEMNVTYLLQYEKLKFYLSIFLKRLLSVFKGFLFNTEYYVRKLKLWVKS